MPRVNQHRRVAQTFFVKVTCCLCTNASVLFVKLGADKRLHVIRKLTSHVRICLLKSLRHQHLYRHYGLHKHLVLSERNTSLLHLHNLLSHLLKLYFLALFACELAEVAVFAQS